jgi:hypothetical protein
MDAINILRQQAAQKRDEAIKVARDEHRQTLRLIDELAMQLFHETQPTRRGHERKRPIIDLIVDYMPKDRPFAIRELLAKLRKVDPKRIFHEPTFRTLFKRLIDQGRIRKVSKGDRGFILWAASECPESDQGPLATVSISNAMESVLRELGPLKPVEIVLAVQERGYRPDSNRRVLLGTLSTAFKRNSDRFQQLDDGRWSTV